MAYRIPTLVSTLALHFAQGRWHWDTGRVQVRTYDQWRAWQDQHYPAPEITPDSRARISQATFTITQDTQRILGI